MNRTLNISSLALLACILFTGCITEQPLDMSPGDEDHNLALSQGLDGQCYPVSTSCKQHGLFSCPDLDPNSCVDDLADCHSGLEGDDENFFAEPVSCTDVDRVTCPGTESMVCADDIEACDDLPATCIDAEGGDAVLWIYDTDDRTRIPSCEDRGLATQSTTVDVSDEWNTFLTMVTPLQTLSASTLGSAFKADYCSQHPYPIASGWSLSLGFPTCQLVDSPQGQVSNGTVNYNASSAAPATIRYFGCRLDLPEAPNQDVKGW